MAQDPSADSSMEKFKKAQADNTYPRQAQFFMNAFWVELKKLDEKEPERFWEYAEKMAELDLQEGKNGHNLDFAKSLDAKLFLEHFGKALTHLELKATLEKIDADNDKRMSLLEFAIWQYQQKDAIFTIDELMKRPQGVNQELIEAQEALALVQAQIEAYEKKKTKQKNIIAKTESQVKRIAAQRALDILELNPEVDNKLIISAEAKVRIAQKAENVNAQGTIWWVQKELEVAESYKPNKKK